MTTGGEILNLEDMFSVLHNTRLLREVVQSICKGITSFGELPPDIIGRNRAVFETVCAYRGEHMEEYVALNQVMLCLSFINADQAATTYVDTTLGSFPELKKKCDDYPNVSELFNGVHMASEKAAVVFLESRLSDESRRAWLILRDYAMNQMNSLLRWDKWINVRKVSRSMAEMLMHKDDFEKAYKAYHRIGNPSFDCELLPVQTPGKYKFIIEMTPPIQPVKPSDRDPDTGHFLVNNNKNICSVVFEYDLESEFFRMTKSRYGDDGHLRTLIFQHILNTKPEPMVKRKRKLDTFKKKSYENVVKLPDDLTARGAKLCVSEIDVSYFAKDEYVHSNAPVKIHDYIGKNIYDQLDILLPPDKYPYELRTIHSVKVLVSLYHQKPIPSQPGSLGKSVKYTITFRPKSIGFSPNIDNPAKVPDREHAKIIEKLVKDWGLQGSPVEEKKN